ncbi:ribose 5-phosphate isomerase B [Poriferisphaera sp. WC338]|uniref:ribose 5-phosphate isomerase B n=1 Tax=Poriferisphaera sp. WC338 TaxID=3425129 RepID=UPI003D813855
MIIAVGSDHRGADMLSKLTLELQHTGCKVLEVGSCGGRMCDYPDMAYPVAQAVSSGQADRGILICGSGIGMSIAANKVDSVRAALVHDEIGAEMSRRHNDANVLCLPADLLGARVMERIVQIWLETEFEGGRHARRVDKIAAIEQGTFESATDALIDTSAAE